MHDTLSVSIGIPAHNEEKNIRHLLNGLLNQKTNKIIINKIVVINSGSTDKTSEIVKEIAKNSDKIVLIEEKERNGKAHAINKFLKTVKDEVLVLESADTIPRSDAIEHLCLPFLRDAQIGMTGGAPIPVDDPNCFLGYIVHAWWWFHRNIPRFGEIIAFRNIIPQITMTTAVDEAFIQAKIVQQGLKVVHIDEAIVNNKGPNSVSDLIKQRRRIFNGHARLHKDENVKINNMTKSSLNLLLYKYEMQHIKHAVWMFGGILIEIYARFLGAYDTHIRKINPYIWDTAVSTKQVLEPAYEVAQ